MGEHMLQDQIALVTGASRGIGQAIALNLGRQGATVIATATSEDGAAKISAYLQEAGIKGRGMVLNVTELEQIKGLIAAIETEFGAGVSILVNNAGITRDNVFMRMKDDEWEDIMDTNLRSAFWLCRTVIRSMMKARSGRIINIASVIGVTGNPGQANYAAAKAGLIGFTRSLAREVGSRNITVNCVAPGFIDTDMTRGLPEDYKAKLLDQIALGRLGRVEDIAGAVSFLAGPQGAYITGNTLHVNGGMYMN